MTTTPDSNRAGYGKLLKHSAIYVFGMILSRAASFFLLPLYTHYLTPEHYGIMGLLSMTCDVISMLVGVGITSAVLRLYSLQDDQKKKNQVVSTALIAATIALAMVFGTLSSWSEYFSNLVLGDPSHAYLVWISFITMTVTAGLEVPLAFLRAQNRSLEFVMINASRLVLQIVFNIWFIVFLDLGVLGVLYSTLISFVVTSIYLVTVTIRETGISFSWPVLKDLAAYGAPLIFHDISAFVLTFSDRYFVSYYGDLRDVGIYSLGYKLGMLVSFLLLGPFHQHWSAEMFNIDKKDNREEVFTNVLTMISAVSIVTIFGVSIFARDVVQLMASDQYIDAWKLVPIISLAYFFYGLAEYTQLGVLITRKTHYVAYSTTIAAGINLALNFLLIPKWGIFGASVSTVLSFYGRFLLVYKFSQKVYPLPYKWYRINTLAIFSGLTVLVSFFLEIDSLVLDICKSTAFALAYLGLVYRYWLNERERGIVIDIIKKPKQAIKLLAKS